MRKILLLSCLIVINCLLDSCFQSSATCYNLDLLAIKNFTLDGKVELGMGDTVTANDYAILLDGAGMVETCMTHYSFGGGLLAEEPVYVLIDEVDNISIKSNSDLSANYPAESELKDLFIPILIDLNCIDNSGTSSNCVTDYFSDSSYNSLEEALNGVMGESIFFDSEGYEHLYSLRIEEMITSNNHEFTIQFDFQSGASIELKTEPIILN